MTETETHQTDVCDHLGLLKLSADKTMASLFWPTLYDNDYDNKEATILVVTNRPMTRLWYALTSATSSIRGPVTRH